MTTNIARTNGPPDHVDYAGLVTSRDLAEFSGEPSVERSIMVVRSTHKVTGSTGFRPVSVKAGTAGTLCGEEGKAMWDTVQTTTHHLSHDMPCQSCGHAIHTYLVCGDDCNCKPAPMPGYVA